MSGRQPLWRPWYGALLVLHSMSETGYCVCLLCSLFVGSVRWCRIQDCFKGEFLSPPYPSVTFLLPYPSFLIFVSSYLPSSAHFLESLALTPVDGVTGVNCCFLKSNLCVFQGVWRVVVVRHLNWSVCSGAVCSVVAARGITALLGNERRSALPLIDAFARTLHVPYISVTSSPPNAAAVMATRDAASEAGDEEDRAFVLYIRPSYRRAIVDVVRAYAWTRVYYIYTDPEGTAYNIGNTSAKSSTSSASATYPGLRQRTISNLSRSVPLIFTLPSLFAILPILFPGSPQWTGFRSQPPKIVDIYCAILCTHSGAPWRLICGAPVSETAADPVAWNMQRQPAMQSLIPGYVTLYSSVAFSIPGWVSLFMLRQIQWDLSFLEARKY